MSTYRSAFVLLAALSLSTFSACNGKDAVTNTAPKPQQDNPTPTPPPAPAEQDLQISEEVFYPKENKLSIESGAEDTQSFLFKFADAAAVSFKLHPGSRVEIGCEGEEAGILSFSILRNGVETPVDVLTRIERAENEDLKVKAIVTGISKCMGLQISFLAVLEKASE